MRKLILLFVVSFTFGNIVAQTYYHAIQSSTDKKQTLRDLPECTSNVPDCNLNDEAKRHMLMAEGMRETMDNTDDMKLVADEYEKALQSAPCCPDIYYNLGLCYEELGKKQPELFDKAILCYQKYLQLNPTAENKSEVEDLIYKIEGKKKMVQKQLLKSQEEEQQRKQEQEEIDNERIKAKLIGTWRQTEWWGDGKFQNYLDDGEASITITEDQYGIKIRSQWHEEIKYYYGEMKGQKLYYESGGDVVHIITLISDNKIYDEWHIFNNVRGMIGVRN